MESQLVEPRLAYAYSLTLSSPTPDSHFFTNTKQNSTSLGAQLIHGNPFTDALKNPNNLSLHYFYLYLNLVYSLLLCEDSILLL